MVTPWSPQGISKAFTSAAGETKVTDRLKVTIQLLTFSVGIVGLPELQGLSMTHLSTKCMVLSLISAGFLLQAFF